MGKNKQSTLDRVQEIVRWTEKNNSGEMRPLAEQSGFRQIAKLFPEREVKKNGVS